VKHEKPLDYATPPPRPRRSIDWDFWFLISILIGVVLLVIALGVAVLGNLKFV